MPNLRACLITAAHARWRRSLGAVCAAAFLVLAAPVATQASFGLKSLDFSVDSAPSLGAEPGAVGPPEVQAAARPYQVTVTFSFNQTADSEGSTQPDEDPKDIQIGLPSGFIGSLVDIPQCPRVSLESSSLFEQKCPADAQVGTLAFDTMLAGVPIKITVPIFNLEHPPGVVGELGAFANMPVFIGVGVRTGGDYGVTVSMRNLPQVAPVFAESLSLWGVPADERHDSLRGECLGFEGVSGGDCPSDASRKPFLTLPGACGKPLQVSIRMDSWQQPGEFVERTAVREDLEGKALGLSGCGRLAFDPAIETKLASPTADTGSAIAAHLHIPQNENPDELAGADVRRAVVTLPPGVSINPAAAGWLGSCRPEEAALDSSARPSCPPSSGIGSVEIVSPLLEGPLQGQIYLAAPGDNPFKSVFAVYLAAERDGVLVKLAGRIDADPDTGQLTLVFDDMPELSFSDLVLNFDGGPRSPLATPPRCGTFTTTTRLTPYSTSSAATPSSSFAVDRGCGGGFSPSFQGGAASTLAGAGTALTLRLSRADGEETFRSFSVAFPPGLAPLLGGVALCAEAQAAAGSCDPASRIGSIAIAAGAGPNPFYFVGSVFLTGPYGGAPFGLSMTIPGVAGPFDLGVVVVRARVFVDPGDAHLTIVTDSLPRILQGIPLRVRDVHLVVDRPGLFVTPTNCDSRWVSGVALSEAGSTASLSSPAPLTGCSELPFSPRIYASTNARVTRTGGAALKLVIRNPPGEQANIHAISIEFPRRLSPRLSAIQAACAEGAFASEPASCPPASVVGEATVSTPVLGTPLRGPAYLVSRGRDALPQLVLVLRAQGVVLRVPGSLRISDAGSIAATFGSIPDTPISRFALRLPRGPHSVLGAGFLSGIRGSFCERKLTMHAQILAQNGLRVRRSLRVSATGCARKQSSPK
jgi:hypothetical protein